jgi:chromosomal replication initiator protein
MKKNHPGLKIIYRTCESFMNELIESIGNHTTTHFKEKYRSADVLLIDDIQFISGKESTQEEFFHTFSALYESEKQIIMTSDRPPKEINPLTERLRTRFEGSVIVEVLPPSFELRTAIIKTKAEQVGIIIPEDVLTYLAENLRSNIRQIEGAMKKLGALAFLSGQEITMEVARGCIADLLGGEEPVSVTVDKIFSAVYKKYGITKEDLVGKNRSREIAQARHISIYLIRKITEMSLPNIGKIFNRDHTTALASYETIEKRIKTDAILTLDIGEMTKEVTGESSD